MVEALDSEGAISRRDPYVHSVGLQRALGRADRAADLAAVVLPHGRAGRAGNRGRRGRTASASCPPTRGNACCWTGCARCGRGASHASSGGGTACRSGTATPARRPTFQRPHLIGCGACDAEIRQETDVLDTWFSSQLWPFAVAGLARRHARAAGLLSDRLPHHRAGDPLPLGRAHDHDGPRVRRRGPFDDVYVHSVILAPDGRRMSKSLGTGIDPLVAIEEQGADALRFGLMAMSSSQDVRYSAKRVEQGRDLPTRCGTRRVWCCSTPTPWPASRGRETVEDRWIVSRLQRLTGRSAQSTLTTSRTPRSSCTPSSGASSATGTWRW